MVMAWKHHWQAAGSVAKVCEPQSATKRPCGTRKRSTFEASDLAAAAGSGSATQ